MKTKILAQLKAKFAGVQVALLDRVADVLAGTVTKEEDIETAVGNSAGLVNSFATFLQSETDRRVTEALTKKDADHAAEIAKLKKTKPAAADDGKHDDEMPAWAKTLLDKVTTLESNNTAKTHREKLIAKLTEAQIPEKFYKPAVNGRSFKDDSEVETFATEIAANFKEYAQELADQGLAITPKPNMQPGTPADKVPANVETYIAAKFDDKGTGKDMGGKKI